MGGYFIGHAFAKLAEYVDALVVALLDVGRVFRSGRGSLFDALKSSGHVAGVAFRVYIQIHCRRETGKIIVEVIGFQQSTCIFFCIHCVLLA